MKKCSFTLNKYIFHLPRRIMDPTSIFVDNLPPNLTYCQIMAAFWPYQQDAPLQILKKEKFLIITFKKEESVQHILEEKDRIKLKGKHVNIRQAIKKYTRPTYIQLSPFVRPPPDVLFPLSPPPPHVLLLPPFFIPAPPAPTAPPEPTTPAPYIHPFPEGFSYFFINSFLISLLCSQ